MTRTFDIDRHDAMTASWSLNTQTRHQIAWRRVVDRMQVTLLVRVPVENEANLPLFIFCCSRSFVKTVCAAFKSFSFSTHIIEGIYNDIYNSLKTECRQIFINQKKTVNISYFDLSQKYRYVMTSTAARRSNPNSCWSDLTRRYNDQEEGGKWKNGGLGGNLKPLSKLPYRLLTLWTPKASRPIVLHRIRRSWYTGWVGCYSWYSKEGLGRAAAPPSPSSLYQM